MNSYSDYVEGSATASYQSDVDAAARIAEQQKRKVDPIHLVVAKSAQLRFRLRRKLRSLPCSSSPHVTRSAGLTWGPRRKPAKRLRWGEEEGMERAESSPKAGTEQSGISSDEGGISADDPEAVQKLKGKLEGLEQTQAAMKAVNAYYRKNKTLDGCPGLSAVEIEKLKAGMARNRRAAPKPYESYVLTNNSAAIRQVKARIEELTRKAETEYEGWTFDGGTVSVDRQANRLRVFFDEKPDRETCTAMRHSGFLWAPSVGAWQRQLTDNAIRDAKDMDCLRPLSAEPPTQVQTQAEPVPEQKTDDGWGFYIIADLKTWATNAGERSELEHYASFEEAKARFNVLQHKPYNSEITDPGPDGCPPARLTLGLESSDGMSAADILHVRQGKNYLVTDFTRTERLREDPAVMDILARVSREIGFDFVRVYEQIGDRYQLLPHVSFAEWDNPYFPSATPGSIAAKYYSFLHECYPLPKDDTLRAGQIAQIVEYIQREGKNGAEQLSLAVSDLRASFPDNAAVQELASALTRELAQYDGLGKKEQPRQKTHHKKSQER